MKPIYFNKLTKLIVAALLFVFVQSAFAAEPLKRGADERLDALYSEIQPAVYLADGEAKYYGDAPLVVNIEVGSEKLLASQQQAFESAEMIIVRLKSAKDESVRLTAAQLNNFAALKYIIAMYEYNACNDGDSCLDNKTKAIITLPNGSQTQVYYHLSIPQ